MPKKNPQPKARERTEIVAPEGAERFMAVIDKASKFTYLSKHEINGVTYQVVAVMDHPDGIAVEFLRVL